MSHLAFVRARAACVVLLMYFAFLHQAHAIDQPTTRILAEGRVTELISAANAHIKTAPSDPVPYEALGRAYIAMHEYDKALNAFEHAVALSPGNSDYHMWLGRAYGAKADDVNFLSAIGWAKRTRMEFEKAVELDQSNVAARSDLAEFYIDAPGIIGGGLDKAAAELPLIKPKDAALAHFLSARIADKQKNQGRAESECKQAIQTSDEPARYWINLASFYKRWGRLQDMQNAITQGMAAKRKRSDVVYYAAELLADTGANLGLASELLQQYLLSPDEECPAFQAHYLLGTVFEKQGKRAAARREFAAALTLNPGMRQAENGLKRVQ